MVATITELERIDRSDDGKIDYFIMRANAVQGDATAEVLDEDGFVNPMACVSRSFNLTKCLFPATAEQADAIETSYVQGGKVRLGLFQIPVGHNFNIVGKDGEIVCNKTQKVVTKTNSTGKPMNVNGKVIAVGKTYEETEDELTPKVFTQVSLVLFVNKDETVSTAEGDTAENIARRNFEAGLGKTYFIVN